MRIGDAPPEPLPAGPRPLSGIRVLDLTRVLAGPTCARTLAEHGADVMKVSHPTLPDSGAFDLDTGLGKLSTYLDLHDPAQAETLRGLVRDGDVFSQSYRPGALAGLGFSPEALAALRPGIVCVTLSAVEPCRSVAGAARVRHRRADGERHGVPARWRAAGVPALLGAGLHRGLPDGVRRDGRPGPAGAAGRQLARARLAGRHGQWIGSAGWSRTRPGPPCPRNCRRTS